MPSSEDAIDPGYHLLEPLLVCSVQVTPGVVGGPGGGVGGPGGGVGQATMLCLVVATLTVAGSAPL